MASPTNSTQLVGLMPAPEGVTPDFFSRTTTQTTFILLFAIMWGLATICVILRLYTRAILVKNVGWDEREYSIPDLMIVDKLKPS